jgi:uroporphyrinogen-III synthase
VSTSFNGLRVLAFESRLSTEMGTLIANYGGHATVAPSMREVPLESNAAALDFAAALDRGEFDIVIFLTGVGTRALIAAVASRYPKEALAAALGRVRVVARGPKPLAVLRELQVPVWITAPEPNTWHEVLSAIDAAVGGPGLRGQRIAVQEYGISNRELLDELRDRGAGVTPVQVYAWALPTDVTPLKNAIAALTRHDVDVVLFTTRVQVAHLFQVASDLGLDAEVAAALSRTVIASIGPTTSEELRQRALHVDVESSHPKLGFLVREAAERAAGILTSKR